jgi:hypothetical protein
MPDRLLKTMQLRPDNIKISRKKLWMLLLLGIAVVTTILLAAGISQLQLLPGQPFPIAGIMQALSDSRISLSNFSLPFNLVRPVIACVWILLIISIIGFIISPQIRKDVFRRVITYSLWALIIYGVIVSLQPFLSSLGEEPAEPSGPGLFETLDSGELLPAPPDFIVDPPQWFVIGISILLVSLFLSIGWFFWYIFSAKKRDSTSLELLVQEAQQALEDLQGGQDLKDTVKRCYFEMSQILSKQRNLHRRRGMTPREFEQYLAEHGLQIEHIQRLTRLFENVRYGHKSPDEQEEQEAIVCLTTIVQTYGRSS